MKGTMNTIPAVEILKLADKLQRVIALYDGHELDQLVVDPHAIAVDGINSVEVRDEHGSFGSHTW